MLEYSSWRTFLLLPPGAAAIAGQQQEWIPRQGIDRLAADPAGLRVPEFDLFERGIPQARRRLLPGESSVVAREKQAEQRRLACMQVACNQNAVPCRVGGGKLQHHRA